MPRRLIVLVLALCLLAGGATLYHEFLDTSPVENATRMAALGLMLLDSDGSVSVLAVRDGSPADRAGIQPGDVLLQADGSAITDTLQLEDLLAQAQRQMCLELCRNQDELLTIQLSLH